MYFLVNTCSLLVDGVGMVNVETEDVETADVELLDVEVVDLEVVDVGIIDVELVGIVFFETLRLAVLLFGNWKNIMQKKNQFNSML